MRGFRSPSLLRTRCQLQPPARHGGISMAYSKGKRAGSASGGVQRAGVPFTAISQALHSAKGRVRKVKRMMCGWLPRACEDVANRADHKTERNGSPPRKRSALGGSTCGARVSNSLLICSSTQKRRILRHGKDSVLTRPRAARARSSTLRRLGSPSSPGRRVARPTVKNISSWISPVQSTRSASLGWTPTLLVFLRTAPLRISPGDRQSG